MTIPLIILAILSTIGGFMGIPAVFGAKIITYPISSRRYLTTPAWRSGGISKRPVRSCHRIYADGYFGGRGGSGHNNAYITYVKTGTVPADENTRLSPLHRLIYHKYYIDEIYNALIVRPVMWLSTACTAL
jgi:NADH-quinone oxidoreductase subunit L